MPFLIGYLLISIVPGARRWSIARLSIPIPAERRREVLYIVAFKAIPYALAIGGGVALWYWATGGMTNLENRMANQQSHEDAMAIALSPAGILGQLLFFSFLGPVLEELVFRGLLYPLWAQRWGWFAAAIASSFLFSLYHTASFQAFVSSVIFVCVYRRTGSLRAPILVHAVGNLSAWPPLMGQFIFLKDYASRTDLFAWWPHFLCLAICAVAIPWYVWKSRDVGAADPHEAS
jgi:membrane protease YdiL (CAAX protease family)